MSETIYYVYAYLRSDGSPYYIGKGKGNRAFSIDHKVNLPKDESRIVFLETNLTNVGALALERRYIRWYGRKDLGTGILRNRTAGGEGGFGKMTEETKKKLSAINKGKVFSKETRNLLSLAQKKVKRNPHSSETKIKISISNRKNNLSPPNLKGMVWWNNGTSNKRSFEVPGPDWTKGRIFFNSSVHKNL